MRKLKSLALFHLFLVQPDKQSDPTRLDIPWKEYGYLSYQDLTWRLHPFAASSVRGAVAWHLHHGSIAQVTRNNTIFLRLTSLGREMLASQLPCFSAPERWDGRWRVIIFTGDSARPRKTGEYRVVRQILDHAGFRPLERGVYVSPYPIAEEVRQSLVKHKVLRMISAFETRSFLLGDEREFAYQAWNLEIESEKYTNISNEYKKLIKVYGVSGRLNGSQKVNFSDLVSSHFSLLENDFRLPEVFFPDGNPWKTSLFEATRLATAISML